MKIAGIIIAILGFLGAVWFRYQIEKPAMTLSEEGTYPELYGPVSALRWYAYAFFALLIVCGFVVFLLKHLSEQAGQQ